MRRATLLGVLALLLLSCRAALPVTTTVRVYPAERLTPCFLAGVVVPALPLAPELLTFRPARIELHDAGHDARGLWIDLRLTR